MTAPAVPVINFYTPADKKLTVYFSPSISGNPNYSAIFYSTDNGTRWYPATTITSPVTVTNESTNGFPLENGTYSIILVGINKSFPDPYKNRPSAAMTISASVDTAPDVTRAARISGSTTRPS